jgi:hypothetical protein
MGGKTPTCRENKVYSREDKYDTFFNIIEVRLSGKYLLIEIYAVLQRNHILFH